MSLSILIFLGLAFVLVSILRLARIGTLLAFLIAGVVAGPYILEIWQVSEIWNVLGEIGIVFLWFTMGLELNIKRLWQMRDSIFGFGAAQVMMVAAMLFPILFGITNWTILGTVMIALMLAMSSTSSDLQLLADRNELQTPLGRQAFSILLFQDLLSIPLLAMLPVFAGKSLSLGADIIDILVMSTGLILGVVIVSRLFLQPLMRAVSRLKSKEAFLLAVILNIILWTVVMDFIGLPPAMGAFLAGMLLSETVYRHQVQAEISPYTMLFLAFFFIALGMGMDLPLLQRNWMLVAGGVIGLIVIKFAAVYIVARVRHVKNREAFVLALLLAQGGEFGLLILQTMKTNGIEAIPFQHAEILTAIIVVSMMMTPILLAIYDQMYRNGRLFKSAHAKKINIKNTTAPAVIICGFGRVGNTIARMLDQEKIPYAAVDLNIDSVIEGREKGYNVFYGDTSNKTILRQIGLAPRKTKAVVIALDNSALTKRTVRAIREITPRMKIFARARNMPESDILRQEGAAVALPETIEGSFLLGGQLLKNIGISEKRIESIKESMRSNNYEEITGIK